MEIGRNKRGRKIKRKKLKEKEQRMVIKRRPREWKENRKLMEEGEREGRRYGRKNGKVEIEVKEG